MSESTIPGVPILPAGVFRGETAFVTGGGTGLGLAVSTLFGRLGARVVCASRQPAHHRELMLRGEREGFDVLTIPLDVRDPQAVRMAVRTAAERFSGISILVNNAAGNFIRPSLALAPRAFAMVIDVALNGVFTVSREVGLVMKERGGGAIVNVSAPYARDGKAGVVHSACAKAGVEAMTRTLAAEWAPLGIRVNAVSPGPFESEGAGARLWPDEEIERRVRESIPLGRFGSADEIALLVAFLASPAASWITGTILLADGGWSLPEPFGGVTKVVKRRRDRSGASTG
jgi:NAD(P)-dependent dehydrogenase (short-subunit alcohol dehydrogenase family)